MKNFISENILTFSNCLILTYVKNGFAKLTIKGSGNGN